MDEQYWETWVFEDGGQAEYAEIAADLDVLQIVIRAQGNQIAEDYWKDVATDLAQLVDELKKKLNGLESAWAQAINLYPDLETILPSGSQRGAS